MSTNRAFTLIELLVVLAIIILLLTVLLPSLGSARKSARTVKDATQINQIHKSMLTYANTNRDNELPIPGKRYAHWYELDGQTYVGRMGSERAEVNDSYNLYSMMIAMEFFAPGILIGPTEVNDIVVRDADYRLEAYNPAAGVYWDDSFSAAIGGQVNTDQPFGVAPRPLECNTSYAHQVIHANQGASGQGAAHLRRSQYWVNYASTGVPVLGTRGLKDGGLTDTGERSDSSPVLELHGDQRAWEGNLCFADNHMEYVKTIYAADFFCQDRGGNIPDNVFFALEERCGQIINPNWGADAWLGIVHQSNPTVGSITHEDQ